MLQSKPILGFTQHDRLPIILAIVIFSVLSIWSAMTSVGFLEADACTHYMYARFALAEPHYLVNVWGRPICTGIYALPALWGGRMGVRLMSLVLALICAILAYQIAKKQNYRRPALALIFTLAQPLIFLHSFSELTELPFAVLLAGGFFAYQCRRYWLMALLIGLTPASRPEGFGFLLLAGLALLVHCKGYWLPLLAMPLVLWNHLGWTWSRSDWYMPWWKWLISEWPYAQASLYKSGYLLHFVGSLPAVVSPLLFPAVLIGMWCCLTRPKRAISVNTAESMQAYDWQRVIDFLIAGIPMLILVCHSLLFWLGKMASNGELRYLLIVAPFWGILSARGWIWTFDRLKIRNEMRWAAAASLAPILVNFMYPVIPLDFKEDWQQAKRVAQWCKSTPLKRDYPFLMASHPGIFYFLDRSWTDPKDTHAWTKTVVDQAPPGTLLIWDPIYGIYNADQKRSIPKVEIERAGWIKVEQAPLDADGFVIFQSPQAIQHP